MTNPSTDESTMRAPKISASLMIEASFIQGSTDAQQNHLAANSGRFGQVAGLQHIHQLIHLLDHLRAEAFVDVDHNAHTGKIRIHRAGHREAFDVVSARR